MQTHSKNYENRRGQNNGFYKHGKSDTKIYQIWNWMIQRCHNPNSSLYERYGAVGIRVCNKWRKFDGFYEDMGEQPFQGASLDRINNAKGYNKENCRWVTSKQQARNRKTSSFIEFAGERKTLAEWAEIYGLDSRLIGCRIKSGWDVHLAFTTKPIKGRNQTWRGSYE